MLKKTLSLLIIGIIIIGMFSSVNATELRTSLNVIQQASETKYLENEQGYISKTIVDSNANTGEVTIELKISNTKNETEQTIDTEIFLVVDNSPSMDFVTSTGETRKELVLNSASQLVTSIFNSSNNVKVGLIDFHGHGAGMFAESASINNATVRQKLTDNKESVLSAIQSELNRATVSGTNIESGLKTAQKNFSQNTNNKVLILLTDGIPNAINDGTYDNSNDVTSEKGIKMQEATKKAITDLKSNGIYTITLLTGMSETDGNTDKNGNEYEEKNTLQENLDAAERVFGTEANPVADKYYLVKNTNINNIITNDILRDVTNKIHNPINTVKIVDYFPEDIIENFEFSYVENASLGTSSENIDTEKKTIQWDIDTLGGNEVATLKYKLKIKDMKNEELLNKTIATNEKVVLTYKDVDAKDYTVTLSNSPKIQLSEIKEELTAIVSYNPTTKTTQTVEATIKTNKKVNAVEGWSLSDDGMTLTKTYSKNATETVHLVDIDNITKDVIVTISNIESNGNETDDKTLANGVLPQTRSKNDNSSIYNFYCFNCSNTL